MSKTTHYAFLMAAMCVLASCGGGDGDTGQDNIVEPTLMTVTIDEPTGPVDNSTLGNWDNTLLGVGEFGPANQLLNNWRGIMSFDISEIPAGATIVSAELTAFQFQVNGDPYFNLGAMMVDHIAMGPVMQGDAYSDFTISLDVGTLSINGTVGVKTLDITGVVQSDVDAARGMTQLRLRFVVPNNDDASIDNAFIAGPESQDAATIKITYTE